MVAGGVGIRAAKLIQAAGQLAAGGYIGEDDVAGVAEQQPIHVQLLSHRSGDMKFHEEMLR